jgi:2-polyprenyl-3-methyl-5-hydroxy-6-metoxy-1,4-benzoquinol methylase
MTTCQCQGIEVQFDSREAAKKLADYQKKGPANTTRILIAALEEAGVRGATLLDVGGGIGAIQLELLKAGVSRAISVEASTAYIETAQQEAHRRGLQDRIQFHHGDFVELAAGLPSADIVTLDRSLCCYPDMPALVGLSASRAKQLYGLVYPRDTWWMRSAMAAVNWLQRLRGASFRGFVHPTQAVEAVLHDHGLRRRFHRLSGVWQVVVFARLG